MQEQILNWLSQTHEVTNLALLSILMLFITWIASTIWLNNKEKTLVSTILDEDIRTSYASSCKFVAGHVIVSFMEGCKVDTSVKGARTLGEMLLHHWGHAHRYHPEKCQKLTGKENALLLYKPREFFAHNNAVEWFDVIIKYKDIDWSNKSLAEKDQVLREIGYRGYS